ncbi:MAG: hypothetical protein J3K34DRAFT_14994 [Monoraphidium minutum]|nr:MAG: hypothetical protein J3K34DRAFT_14994 [Monoraphidium minutum]
MTASLNFAMSTTSPAGPRSVATTAPATAPDAVPAAAPATAAPGPPNAWAACFWVAAPGSTAGSPSFRARSGAPRSSAIGCRRRRARSTGRAEAHCRRGWGGVLVGVRALYSAVSWLCCPEVFPCGCGRAWRRRCESRASCACAAACRVLRAAARFKDE